MSAAPRQWKLPAIFPSEFDSVVERFSKHALGQHEDAHELFDFVVDAAHTELERLTADPEPSGAKKNETK